MTTLNTNALNTNFNELLTLCVANNLLTLSALCKFLEYPYRDLFQTVKDVSNGRNLFQTVKQELFKQGDWFNDDYEFAPNERIEFLEEINKDLFITDYGILLQRKSVTAHGKTFCKFVEVIPYLKDSSKATSELCIQRKVDGKLKRFMVSRLVATHFVTKRNENHNRVKVISGNGYDLHYTNLKWW